MAKPSFSTSPREVWLLWFTWCYCHVCYTAHFSGGFLVKPTQRYTSCSTVVFMAECVWRKSVETRWEITRGRAQIKPGPSSHPRLDWLSGEDSEGNWGDGRGHLNFLMRLVRNPFYNTLTVSCNLPHESIFAGFPLQLQNLHFKG